MCLSGCSASPQTVKVIINNLGNQSITGNLYVSKQKIGSKIEIQPGSTYQGALIIRDIVDSFKRQGFQEGSLSFQIIEPKIVDILLSGYIEPGSNEFSGKSIVVKIKQDFSYSVDFAQLK